MANDHDGGVEVKKCSFGFCDSKRVHCTHIAERPNRMDLYDVEVPVSDEITASFECVDDRNIVRRIGESVALTQNGAGSRIAMTGGHLIKAGLSLYLIDLIERGVITHVATNGAALIHDFELSLIGGTSEDVAKWLKVGQFGLWKETGQLNDVINEAARRGEGMGEGIGRAIEEGEFPHRDVSIAAACYRKGIPLTCHVSIGSDIIHCHPNCNGAAIGQTSYLDFLRFAGSVQNLENGVFLNIGSAVTGPEVFLKALSMARNIAHQDGKSIRNFTTGVFDMVQLPDNYREGPPPPDHPLYYFRPWKTLLCRTVLDGGQSHYVCGDFRDTIPALWQEVVSRLETPVEAGDDAK